MEKVAFLPATGWMLAGVKDGDSTLRAFLDLEANMTLVNGSRGNGCLMLQRI